MMIRTKPVEMPLGDAVEMICTYLGAALDEQTKAMFDDVEPCVAGWGEEELNAAGAGILVPSSKEEDAAFDSMVVNPNRWLLGQMNYSSFHRGTDGFAVARVRRVLPREFRGRTRFMPFVARFDVVHMTENGETTGTDVSYAGWNGRWHSLDRRYPEMADEAKAAVLWQGFRERNWRVSVGFEDCPTVSLAMGPHGIREMFALRDIPNGKSRRAALRHWVSEHWRKYAGVEDAAKVREHLRGGTDFTWNGLRCSVRLPPIEHDPYRPEARIKWRQKEAPGGSTGG